MSDNKTNTTIEQVSVDADELDNLLGSPGADVAMTDPNAETAPTFFQKEQVDMTVLDPPSGETEVVEETTETPEAEETQQVETPAAETNADEAFNDLVSTMDNEDLDNESSSHSNMSELVTGLIEKKLLVPFDDDKPLNEYTQKDYEDLIAANFEERERKVRESTPAEFFDALPHELQYAAKYVADGGEDLKGLFSALSQVEEQKNLDPENDRDAEKIVREYLVAKQFGDQEEIEEEIENYKDLDKISNQAKKFKPKLDKMRESVVQQKIEAQDQKRKQQEEASMNYMNSVYETLKSGDLGGIKINPKTQNMLYSGLVQPTYNSISGKQTNLLGHLLEKHQFIEPNHELVAEALWLLADPTGYKSKLTEGIKNEHVEETVRTLKTEASSKNAGSLSEPSLERKPKGMNTGLKRPNPNFFKQNK